ncbi:MAG TPA: hypothetical protein VH475_09895 [Tepidisphaeraceae bacterium]|jgi:hypothetical protein
MTAQRRKDSRTRQETRHAAGSTRAAPLPAARNRAAFATKSTTISPKCRESINPLPAAAAVVVPPVGPDNRHALTPAAPPLLERAELLRDDLLRSKLTHPNPWSYTAKARAWTERAQALVDEIAVTGQTPTLNDMLAKLDAEVDSDPDFQRARQLF